MYAYRLVIPRQVVPNGGEDSVELNNERQVCDRARGTCNLQAARGCVREGAVRTAEVLRTIWQRRLSIHSFNGFTGQREQSGGETSQAMASTMGGQGDAHNAYNLAQITSNELQVVCTGV